MEHANVEAARASIEAMMKGDLQAMAAGIAEDAVWHVPGAHRFAGDYRGRENITGRFQTMAEAGTSLMVDEIHDIVGNDEHVVAMVRTTLTAPAGTSSQGSIWIFHVADGKATEFWARNDDQAAIDALIGS
jgi:hypothetical protein